MAHQDKKGQGDKKQFAFERKNYILLITGLVLLAVGFLLMIGGKSEDPNVFNYAIFNFRRLTLSPIIILAGFIIEIYAIMWRPKSSQ